MASYVILPTGERRHMSLSTIDDATCFGSFCLYSV
jgi:hypothetical protein